MKKKEEKTHSRVTRAISLRTNKYFPPLRICLFKSCEKKKLMETNGSDDVFKREKISFDIIWEFSSPFFSLSNNSRMSHQQKISIIQLPMHPHHLAQIEEFWNFLFSFHVCKIHIKKFSINSLLGCNNNRTHITQCRYRCEKSSNWLVAHSIYVHMLDLKLYTPEKNAFCLVVVFVILFPLKVFNDFTSLSLSVNKSLSSAGNYQIKISSSTVYLTPI